MQLYAARIVTGLPIIASKDSLYFETGWKPFCERRKKAKLTTMYKMHTTTVTEYLCDNIANLRLIDSKEFYAVSAIFQPCNGGSIFEKMHNTRNEEKYLVPKCSL